MRNRGLLSKTFCTPFNQLTTLTYSAMQVAFYIAGVVSQVLDVIPWVRCASGNVYILLPSQSAAHWLQ